MDESRRERDHHGQGEELRLDVLRHLLEQERQVAVGCEHLRRLSMSSLLGGELEPADDRREDERADEQREQNDAQRALVPPKPVHWRSVAAWTFGRSQPGRVSPNKRRTIVTVAASRHCGGGAPPCQPSLQFPFNPSLGAPRPRGALGGDGTPGYP